MIAKVKRLIVTIFLIFSSCVEGDRVDAINKYLGARNDHFGSDVSATVTYTDVDVTTRMKKENGKKPKPKKEHS